MKNKKKRVRKKEAGGRRRDTRRGRIGKKEGKNKEEKEQNK